MIGNPFIYSPGTTDWIRILPELVLLAAVLLVLLADLVGSPTAQKGWLSLLGLLGVAGSAVVTAVLWANGAYGLAFFGMVTDDQSALLADLIILFAVALGLLFSPGYIERQGIAHQGEYYALLLTSGVGMMLMASASNLMIVFVGLEVLSLSLYILCAIVPGRLRSQEAGMKYFILSSFASAFLLYGMAMIFGSTGSTDLASISAFVAKRPLSMTSGYGPLLLVGLGLMAVGFCFKVSAVPFQAWTPDVYVGAPTPITAFMSVGTKVAAFTALARVFVYALQAQHAVWMPVFWVVAVLTMVLGNLFSVTQRDVKRMLAYSSVANGGYLLVTMAVNSRPAEAALFTYLAAYAAMNLGAFGVVSVLEQRDGLGTTLDDFAGLSRRYPWLAAAMAVFMFALAGVPLTIGFVGKWYIFYAAIVGGHLELAIIGLMASVLGMFYYLRVVWAMYFSEPQPFPAVAAPFAVAPAPAAQPAALSARQVAAAAASGAAGGVAVVEAPAESRPAPEPMPVPAAATVAPRRVYLTPGAAVSLAAAVVFTIGLGIVPGGLVTMAQQAATWLFR